MEQDLEQIAKLQNADEWPLWKFKTTVLLKSYNAWKVATGDFQKPDEPAQRDNKEAMSDYQKKLSAYEKADGIAQRVLIKTLSDQFLIHIVNFETSKEMWDKLIAIFDRKSEAMLNTLQQSWYNYSKDPSDNIAAHIAKIENIAFRLKAMKVTCEDSDIMFKIINTLPDAYNHFCTAWESTAKAEQTKVNLIARLQVEEERMLQREARESKALVANSQYPGHYTKGKGYQGKNFKKNNVLKCYVCGKPGHKAFQCRLNAANKRDSEKKKVTYGEAVICEAFASELQKQDEADVWYKDSGASDHMTYRREWFVSFEPLQSEVWVRLAGKQLLKAQGRGSINVLTYDNNKWRANHLSNVLYVPELQYNLFSANAALDKGMQEVSDKYETRFIKNGKVIVTGKRKHEVSKLFVMQIKVQVPIHIDPVVPKVHCALAADSLESWHQKFVHQNCARVKHVLNRFDVKFQNNDDFFCDACAVGKAHRLPFPKSVSKTSRIGELVHADVCGPMQVGSLKGSRYFLLLKDDFSHYRHVYFLSFKNESKACIRDFLLKCERHCPSGIKTLRTDNGLEFICNEVSQLLSDHGVTHQRTVAYTPEQNGSAERENRTIVEAARTVLQSSEFPIRFWAEAVKTVVYVLNRTSSSSVKDVTPFELWHQSKPNIQGLHVFGQEVFTHVPKIKRQKWDSKAKKGFFIGYEDNTKGFRIWYPDTGKIEVSRDVIFGKRCSSIHDKNQTAYLYFPGEENTDVHNSNIQEGTNNEEICLPDQPENNLPDVDENNLITDIDNEESAANESDESSDNLDETVVANSSDGDLYSTVANDQEQPQPYKNRLRDPSLRKQPNKYDGYVTFKDAFIAAGYEPIHYQDAVSSQESSKWYAAMQEEMNSLQENQVWKLVYPPEGTKVVGCRWVYKIKNDATGKAVRYKARLVAKGYNQQAEIDYQETFSPVVRYESIRLLLSLAAKEELRIKQFDIKTAYLNGNIEEEIYMEQPVGFSDKTNRVCKLQRSLYGLKQSSRCWNLRFTNFLKSNKLRPSDADPCVFISEDKGKRVIVAIFIDDGLLITKEKEDADRLLQEMKKEFEVTESLSNMFLGMQIGIRKDGSIILHQATYAAKLIEKFKLQDVNPVKIPADPHSETCIELHTNQRAINAPYREAVGSLLYLSNGTRPDITFAVNKASRYLENPTKIHWNTVKRIFKYLKGSLEYGLVFTKEEIKTLDVYSDADFAGELESRKSTSGWLVQFGSDVISWSSQRQSTVALSTTESEYIASCLGAMEIMWFRKLLSDLHVLDKVKFTLYIDNKSAICLIKNPVFHKKTKHIDTKYHFVRLEYEKKMFNLEYVNTKNQLADMLTKALPFPAFDNHRSKICAKVSSDNKVN